MERRSGHPQFKLGATRRLNADYRGGVTCLYDTQLLGACLHASESGGRSRPEAVRGMPDVPIAPQPPGPRRGGRLSALSAQPLSTGGCARVCLGFWVLDLRFWGRKESGSGFLTVSDRGLIRCQIGLPMATSLSYPRD